MNMFEGEKGKVESEVIPEDASVKTVTWYTENADVAEVDEYGNVKAVKKGETEIVCESLDGTVVKKCKVVVTTSDSGEEKNDEKTQTGCKHDYRIKTVVDATCTKVGTITMSCSLCGDILLKQIPLIDHDYSSEWTIDQPATATENGIKSHHCIRCEARKDITVIQKTGAVKATTPTKVTGVSVSTGKTKQLKVKWKKVSSATGYQIMYSTDKKFKKSKNTITIKKKSQGKITLKKLKKGKKYYVKVRAYNKSGNQVLYGKWSKVKSKTCK